MEFITVECMNTKPHAPHTWREGFMWHRKRECGGVPQKFDRFAEEISTYCEADIRYTEALYETHFTKEEHRHYYGFCAEKSDRIYLVWECLDPFCKDRFTRFRSVYRYETLVPKAVQILEHSCGIPAWLR